MKKSLARAGFAAMLATGVLLGASGCVIAPAPTDVAISSGPVVSYYSPLYYDGYVVYYDGSGYPYYYLNSRIVYVPKSYRGYGSFVVHYQQHQRDYRRWYKSRGVHYRGYRRPGFDSKPPRKTQRPSPRTIDRASRPPSGTRERTPAPTPDQRFRPSREDWTRRESPSTPRFNRDQTSPRPTFDRESSPSVRERTSPTRGDWSGRTPSATERFGREQSFSPTGAGREPTPIFRERASPTREDWSERDPSASERFGRDGPSSGGGSERGTMPGVDRGRFQDRPR